MSDSFAFSDAFHTSIDGSANSPVTSSRMETGIVGQGNADFSYEDENEATAPKRKRASSKTEDPATSRAHGQRRSAHGKRAMITERQKITRACDPCKRRKSRCSGTLPCKRCMDYSISCKYETPHRRGQPASPPRDVSLIPQEIGSDQHVSQLQEQHQLKVADQALPDLPSNQRRRINPVDPEHSLRSSPGKGPSAFEGQYIGPTSGLTFLYRAKSRLRQDFSSSTKNGSETPRTPCSIFNFGDKPFAHSCGIELVLPDRQQAREQVKRYFEFAIPTYRFLHQGTVERWLEKLIGERQDSNIERKALADGKAAVVLMVLATSTLYRVDDTAIFHDAEVEEYDQSGMLFAAAERRLSTERGPARLESVQARLAQCLYLMGTSRTNQAWYLFGTTAQLILSLGLHSRRHSWTSSAGSSPVESECRKRVFWCAYALDKYFNIILGRPGIFRDEDVDQQLPARVNDADLTEENSAPRPGWNQCIMDAPVYHIKLSQIINGICNSMYSIHQIPRSDLLVHAGKWTNDLKAWKESLPAFLEPAKVDPSILVPIFQRQSTVLTLAYAHAVMLATRQFLLSNFLDLTRPASTTDHQVEAHIQECVEAALVAVNTVSYFVQNGMLYRTFWFSQYISFCAIATLYVYTIRRFHASKTSSAQTQTAVATSGSASKRGHMECFEAAEKCRILIANKTDNNSPSRRYSIILDELKRQVLAELENTSSRHNGEVLGPARDSSGAVGNKSAASQDEAHIHHAFADRQFDYLDTGISSARDVNISEEQPALDLSTLVDPTLASGQFELPFDFIGWSELDSWAMAFPETPNQFGSVSSQ